MPSMPASFSLPRLSRGRSFSARSRRMLAPTSTRDWVGTSKGIFSGVALAVLVQLTSAGDCARAADETVTVPRGALEELILRDLSHRIRDMDSTSLSSFMQNLKELSAPDPRSNPPSDPAATSAQAAESKSAVSETADGAVVDRAAQSPAPTVMPPSATRMPPSAPPQQDTPASSRLPPSEEAPGVPKAPPESTYSIFRDREPSITSSQTADDLTAQLLGFRTAPDTLGSGAGVGTAGSVSDGSEESWTSVLGLPLAVWTKLDQVLPADLRAASGEPLTEEVQRAVYVVKGLILIASSALAYFLSRALLSQLAKVVLAVPIVQQASRATQVVAESAQQVRPELLRRASAVLNSLPGGPSGPGAGIQQQDTGIQPGNEAVQAQLPREAPGEPARSVGVLQEPKLEGRPGADSRVQPPPLPLVPTAQGALYNVGQGQWEKRSLRQRDGDDFSSAGSPATGDGVGGVELGARVRPPVDVRSFKVAQDGSGSKQGNRQSEAVVGTGVLWRRGGGSRPSQLSERWADVADHTSQLSGVSDSGAAGPARTRDADAGLAGPRQGENGASSSVGVMNEAPPGERLPDEVAAGMPKGLASGHQGLDKPPIYENVALNNVPLQSGKDPWFG